MVGKVEELTFRVAIARLHQISGQYLSLLPDILLLEIKEFVNRLPGPHILLHRLNGQRFDSFAFALGAIEGR